MGEVTCLSLLLERTLGLFKKATAFVTMFSRSAARGAAPCDRPTGSSALRLRSESALYG